MWREILKIIPKLDESALAQMDRSLGARFNKIAKKFGSGLVNALKGGGIIAAAGAILDKLLNPLKETQEAIDRMLAQGDDIATNAKQFNTTAGKLFVLQGLARSTGLDASQLYMLMTKYQTAIAEAKADPTKETSVRNYANDTDIAESFFRFIQNLQKLDSNDRVLVQKEVFGEKQILKMADFLDTVGSNPAESLKNIKARPSEEYTPRLEKLADLNYLKDSLAAQRGLEDAYRKGGMINKGMVYGQNTAEKKILEQENKRIAAYDTLRGMDEAVNGILKKFEDVFLFLSETLFPVIKTALDLYGGFVTTMLGLFKEVAGYLKTLVNSPMIRGIFRGGKEK